MVPLNLARQRYPRPSLDALKQAFNNSVSFLIVRHPLERLLSAYRDKIQHSLPHTYHRKLGNEIILKYRKNGAKVRLLLKLKSFNKQPTIISEKACNFLVLVAFNGNQYKAAASIQILRKKSLKINRFYMCLIF